MRESKVQVLREKALLTQVELADKADISVRTLQRVEAGALPKGHTLRSLAAALEVDPGELIAEGNETASDQSTHKLINISSLPGTLFPPLNIILPLAVALFTKRYDQLSKQLISLQLVWTLGALFIFFLASFLNNSIITSRALMPLVMALLFLSNVLIIIRNAATIHKKGELAIKLNFSIL